ncbi:MAG TPA: hypothetical protein VK808_07355 [Bacteroidia bacterium]|jgi:hypothetical protein|nr:hypothetical protein [Bacteroidia bacterium]
MNRIVIEVDDEVAKAFMHADKSRQKSISSAINGWLKKIVNRSSLSQYKQMLDAMGDEAIANGLTQEKLEQLLSK